ncbi:hypothetical protein WA1_44465 [Scytonema hofmannii PCC 7110]|uniref:Aminoglycoside phosphotransferase domain-containing protein n=1 Tax=Scytonema hofmannii PCC 7110 TaxID=128403 RepID=A0A139WWC3_9CYAN|nr:phosphotransferase [Scytonema hofmannii]KYC36735.1 hypothetical protein WA1_44465 [Scytonema hofmannii PCC 7110]
MKPFAELSYSGQVKRLLRLAQSALLNYNIDKSRLVCLAHGENTTFKVELGSDKLSETLEKTDFWYVLRIYRPGKHDFASIHSELLWLLSLQNKTDLAVAQPVSASDGSLFVMAEAVGVPEARYCTLFRWLPGRFLDAGLSPKAIMLMGIFLAQLHQYSQQFIVPKGFVRPQIDEERLFGTFPTSLPIESTLLVSQSNQAVLEASAKKIRSSMQYLRQHREFFGLIHGDLHYGNCKFYKGKIQVFDFDDCGWSYYLYDLAVTLYYFRNRSEYPVWRTVLLESYQEICSLPKQNESCLDALIAARRLHLLRHLLQRQDNPKLRALTPKFIDSSVEELNKFLNQ